MFMIKLQIPLTWPETESKYIGNLGGLSVRGPENAHRALARERRLPWLGPCSPLGGGDSSGGEAQRGGHSVRDGDPTRRPWCQAVGASLQPGIWGFRIWFY